MNTITNKLIAAGILSLLTLVSGVIVTRSGRPLSLGLVSIHKLIAVGSVVLIGMAASQLLKTANGKVILEVGILVISGVLFLALIATGALLTREEMQLPAIVLKIHQAAPLLAILSSAVSIFMLIKGRV